MSQNFKKELTFHERDLELVIDGIKTPKLEYHYNAEDITGDWVFEWEGDSTYILKPWTIYTVQFEGEEEFELEEGKHYKIERNIIGQHSIDSVVFLHTFHKPVTVRLYWPFHGNLSAEKEWVEGINYAVTGTKPKSKLVAARKKIIEWMHKSKLISWCIDMMTISAVLVVLITILGNDPMWITTLLFVFVAVWINWLSKK